MKCWVYLFLSLFVVLVASAKTSADVSDNLLSNNFMDDWSGTNNHFHGANILAGEHDKSREQTITLSDHLSSMEIQGVTSTEFNAEVWFWNNYSQSVDLTQEITDSDGLTYSNTITMSGDCGTFNGCGYETSPTNKIIINDVASDYDITTRFSFSVPSRPNNHYAADVKEPNLVVNYEPFSIDLSTTDDINNWLSDFEEQFREDFKEPDFFITKDFYTEPDTMFDDYFLMEEPTVIFAPEPEYLGPTMNFMDEAPIFFSEEEMELPMTTEDVLESMEFMMMPEEMKEEVMELMKEEPAEMEVPEEMKEEMPEDITDEAEDMLSEPEILTEEEFVEESIKEEVPAEIKEDVSMEDEKQEEVSTDDVEDIKIKKSALAQAIEVDQVQITLMIDLQPVMLDAVFYTPINIYPQQITMVDNREIYGNISYVVNDPLTRHNNLINGNREQQYEIRTKLQGMRWIN